ncbi:MAG TPA: ABC transporter permease [Gammaproteobacteria bacterium]|nr:ABC transporter permease [Gammaproteobacteria bacterium]
MSVFSVVCRKEIADNARDKRTLFSALIFGPLFGPVLFAVLISVLVSRTLASFDESISVPIVGAAEAPNFVQFLAAGGIHAVDDGTIHAFDDAVASVKDRRHDIVLYLDAGFGKQFAATGTGRVELIFDQSNAHAASRLSRVRNAVNAYARQIGTLKLLARGVHPRALTTLQLDELDVSTPAARSAVLLGMLTYFLLLATLMGGFYLAIDSTAGERERRSLEPLLTTPAPRTSLLLGKMAAAVCYMWLSLALTLAGFTIALKLVPLERLGMSSSFDVQTALVAFAVLAPFAPLGAALMTLVASFTKSYKEAQTYLTLVLLVPTLPLVFATILNVAPSPALMWIPSLSQHLLVTALIKQQAITPAFYAESTLCTLAAGALLVRIATRLYAREGLLG